MNVYNLSLTSVFLLLLLLGEGVMLSIFLDNPNEKGRMFAFCYVTAGILFLIGTVIVNGYEYLGTMEILPDRLVFRAPLHRAITFKFAEIADIGIDYGVVSGRKIFFIYIGKQHIPQEFTHQILRMKFTEKTMRIKYRHSVFSALLNALPKQTLGKSLGRSASVIRLYHLDD